MASRATTWWGPALAATFLFVVAAGAGFVWWRTPRPPGAILVEVRQRLSSNDAGGAAAALRPLALHPRLEGPQAFDAGSIALGLGEFDLALALLARVPQSPAPLASRARMFEGIVLVQRHQGRQAEEKLRASLALEPSLPAVEALAQLSSLRVSGEPTREWLRAVRVQRPLTPVELQAYWHAHEPYAEPILARELLRGQVDADPMDAGARRGLSRYLLSMHEPGPAWDVIQSVPLSAGDGGSILADRAEALLELDRPAKAGDELASLRKSAADPVMGGWQYFRAVGRYHARTGARDNAAQAFEIAHQLNPVDRAALAQWIALRRSQGADATDLARRLARIESIVQRLRQVAETSAGASDAETRQGLLKDAVGYLVEVGWGYHAQPFGDLLSKGSVISVDLAAASPPSRTARVPEVLIPAASAEPVVPISPIDEPTGERQPFQWHASAGIDFQYFAGDSGKKWLIESMGGGVGVIDVDNDDLPDLYFPQGRMLPLEGPPGPHVDRLFRNRGDDTFEDITLPAGLGDPNYSLGCAVGDLDNDGDADLVVTNFGTSVYCINQGDGTFRPAQPITGSSGVQMSTSAALADLDGDGDLDLYIANYLENLVECRDADGEPRVCHPSVSPGQQDRLYVNRGDGTFRDATADSGIEVPDGKSLGVLVADFDGDRKADIYVANDTTANFLFHNQTTEIGSPKFSEMGFAWGCALSGDGVAQAGMGIAAADFDGDGPQDLVVTNFFREGVTFYHNLSVGGFLDETRKMKLLSPTAPNLGFGVQAIDFDLDGWQDLAVSNGHIDRLPEVPWKMKPQLFKGKGPSGFTDLSSTAGAYFQREVLGRGMSRLDVNRDGALDLVIVHQDVPPALLVNRGRSDGSWIAIELVGRVSNRDGVLTRIEVDADGHRQTLQATGGGGYLSANETILIVGVDDAPRIDGITVRWPGGADATFRDLPTRQRLVVVEAGAHHLRGHRPGTR